MNILIEEKKITITDDNISVFLEFIDKIDESKIERYIDDLKEQLQHKKNQKDYFNLTQNYIIELSYKEQRKTNYPPIDEQLDMLYWDLMNGTDKWRDKITEIKTKYPKPTLK
jgi:DUF2075 family protein